MPVVEWALAEIGIESEWKGEGIAEKGYDTKSGRCLIEVDPHYFQSTEVELLFGNPAKANSKLVWKHHTSVKNLYAEMACEDLKSVANKRRLAAE